MPTTTSESDALAFSNPTALRSATLPVTRMSQVAALADVEAAVRRAGGVGVGDDAVLGVEGVDPVEPIVEGSDVVDPESLEGWELLRVPLLIAAGGGRRGPVLIVQAGEQNAVERRAGHGQVLHAYAVGDRDDAVGPDSSAVDHGGVAIGTANRDVRSIEEQLLWVVTGPDQDGAARRDQVRGVGERRRVLGYPDQRPGRRVGRHFAARCRRRSCSRPPPTSPGPDAARPAIDRRSTLRA